MRDLGWSREESMDWYNEPLTVFSTDKNEMGFFCFFLGGIIIYVN
jgi:hypothetical protein